MILAAKGGCQYEVDEADRMTLKHHARDMIAAGKRILEYLDEAEE